MRFSMTLHFDRFASTGDAHNWRTANARTIRGVMGCNEEELSHGRVLWQIR
jgi:hypothetical protein